MLLLYAKRFIAGGGAYYFAKRSVNADRAARYEQEMKRQRLKQSLETEYSQASGPSHNSPKPHDHAGSPSTEASHDPAPAGHSSLNGDQKLLEEDKYLAKKTYRSKKGDRLS